MTYEIHNMDCRLAMSMLLAPDSVDSIVCDPPYGLSKEPDAAEVLRHWLAGDDYTHDGNGFMGKSWDSFVPGPAVWREAYRVLRPGGYLLAFFGTRTYDLGVMAIRLAGFEIRDEIAWCYGQGFPKSLNVSAAIDRCVCEGCSVPYDHDRTPPPPEHDLRSVLKTDLSTTRDDGTKHTEALQSVVPEQDIPGAVPRAQSCEGGLRAVERLVEGRRDAARTEGELRVCPVCSVPGRISDDGAERRLHNGAPLSHGEMGGSAAGTDGSCASCGSFGSKQSTREPRALAVQSKPQIGGAWEICGRCDKPMVPAGVGTALKPAHEPVVVARKPLAERTVAANVQTWGTGGLNIDASRVGTDAAGCASAPAGGNTWDETNCGLAKRGDPRPVIGRFPANLIHDGSDEVAACFPSSAGQLARASTSDTLRAGQNVYGVMTRGSGASEPRGDSGSAARFFKSCPLDDDDVETQRLIYCAKASRSDRDEGLGGITSRTTGDGPAVAADNAYQRGKTERHNHHATVKPTALMRYLVRLVTPPGGMVLDPFTGSGSTGKAALLEGFSFIGCELDAEYVTIAEARCAHALATRT